MATLNAGVGIDYLHSYHGSRSLIDWNRCGQAAVAALLDHHGLDPYGLSRPIYDERDGTYHWRDGEVIDRISKSFPPDHVFGLFGTTPRQIEKALEFGGLRARALSSRDATEGRKIWEEARRSVKAGFPVIAIMDRSKLGGRPFAAHWGVIYRIEGSAVHIANTKNVTHTSESEFLPAFSCRFMPPTFNHCAILARPVVQNT